MHTQFPLARCALAALAGLICGVAQAQATHTSATLTPQAALTVAQTTLAACRADGYQVAVVVTDRAGTPIVMLRDRDASPHTPDTAARKAYTAVNFRASTANVAKFTEAGAAASGLRHLDRVMALGGGLPIQAAGALVGGIGVSGAPGGHLDEACAQAGIDAIRAELGAP